MRTRAGGGLLDDKALLKLADAVSLCARHAGRVGVSATIERKTLSRDGCGRQGCEGRHAGGWARGWATGRVGGQGQSAHILYDLAEVTVEEDEVVGGGGGGAWGCNRPGTTCEATPRHCTTNAS